MRSVNAQERPWKSSEVFDIKINSDSAQCTLQVSIPMPGTRKKRRGKTNSTPQPILDPPSRHVFRLIPKSLWCFLLLACQLHHPGTNSYRKLSPWSENPGGFEGRIWLLGLVKMPGECCSPRAQPWLSVLSIPWRKVGKEAGAAFSSWF